MVGTMNQGEKPGHDPPCDLQTWKPKAWPHMRQDDLRGDEHDDVSDIEERGKARRPTVSKMARELGFGPRGQN